MSAGFYDLLAWLLGWRAAAPAAPILCARAVAGEVFQARHVAGSVVN